MIRAALAAGACALASCSVPDLDLEGKRCPCVAGWVCDDATDTCIQDPTAPDAPPGTLADAGPQGCPAGYAMVAGATAQYRVVPGLTEWLFAEQDCENDGTGTHLVIFDDVGERDAVLQGLTGDWWIGISDRVNDGTWLAVTGQATFFTAGANPAGMSDCGLADVIGTIGTQSCFTTDSYICECDGVPADPAFY